MERERESSYGEVCTRLKRSVIDAIQRRDRTHGSDILFLSPPYWDVYSPFSAVPCLAAKLRAENYQVRQLDLGIHLIHHIIKTEWKKAVALCTSETFYEERVRPFVGNPYETYEAFLDGMWFFQGEHYCLKEVKARYEELNEVQCGVINVFYTKIYRMHLQEFNFDHCDNLDQQVEQCLTPAFLGTLCEERILEELRTLPQVVGISITGTGQFLLGCAIAKLIKASDPSIQIIFGGSCADLFVKSRYPRKTDLRQYFDYVMVGEGETAITQLMGHIQARETALQDIPNLALWGDDGELVFTRRIMEDVTKLPKPDYDGLDLDLYLAPNLVLPYQTSRGCHYGHCAFCDHDSHYRHNYRSKKMDQVAAELCELSRKYHTSYIQFVDEAIRPDSFQEMVDEMDRHPEFKGMKWFYYSRVSRVYSRELLEKARRNGCEMVMFGIETFNQRLLTFIKKGITADTSKYCLELFHRCGIKTFAWLMCNLPSESIEEAEKDFTDTLEQTSNMDAFVISLFYLGPNTDMYQNPSKYNITRINEKDGIRFQSHHDGVEIDKEQMINIYERYKKLQWKLYFTGNRYTLFFRHGDRWELTGAEKHGTENSGATQDGE